MLTAAEKRRKCISFIESKDFGQETYNTLFLFNVNVSYIIQIVKLYDTLVHKLGTKDFPTEHSELQMLRIKQLVMLDAISRLEAAIESTLILIDELANGYGKLSRTMTFYELTRVRTVMKKIIRRKRPYCMRKVLGLPDIGSLGLSVEERKLLSRLYLETENRMLSHFKKLAMFYDRYRILYGKHKHGLTLEPGGSFYNHPTIAPLEDSILYAYDHKELDDMPIETLTVKETTFRIGNWFNVQSALKFNQAANEELWEMVYILKDVVGYVTWNHLDFALNCGESYLPTDRIDETHITFLFFPNTPLSSEDGKIAQSIMNKLIDKMNLARGGMQTSRSTNDSRVLKSIIYDSVTNLWFTNR